VPVVTLSGVTFASRVAGSLLRAAGLPELITYSRPEYEALALRLAHDPGELQAVRAKLAAVAAAPLFDTPAVTRSIEAAYEKMWELFESGRPPGHIRVSALTAS
jgi:predicted O-linked N-acetylglucosamine transferase (SPINDLY family)